MKKFFEEFKKFAMRGNVMDMAVGVIVGGAFGKIVTSLVNDLFMPLIGLLTGGVNVSGMFLLLGKAPEGTVINTIDEAPRRALPPLTMAISSRLSLTSSWLRCAFSCLSS